jgi:hypothetical protein
VEVLQAMLDPDDSKICVVEALRCFAERVVGLGRIGWLEGHLWWRPKDWFLVAQAVVDEEVELENYDNWPAEPVKLAALLASSMPAPWNETMEWPSHQILLVKQMLLPSDFEHSALVETLALLRSVGVSYRHMDKVEDSHFFEVVRDVVDLSEVVTFITNQDYKCCRQLARFSSRRFWQIIPSPLGAPPADSVAILLSSIMEDKTSKETLQAAKIMKAVKAMKAAKPLKAMKAAKPIKAMKAAKPMKTMKAAKPLKAMKALKPIKALKAMRATKATQIKAPSR